SRRARRAERLDRGDPVRRAVLHGIDRGPPNRAAAEPALRRPPAPARRTNRLPGRHPNPEATPDGGEGSGGRAPVGSRPLLAPLARWSARPARRTGEPGRPYGPAAVLPRGLAGGSLARLQHAPSSVPQPAPAPSRQLCARPARTR